MSSRCISARRVLLVVGFGLAAMLAYHHAEAAHLMLSWTDNSADESGFVIERRIAPAGRFSEIAVAAADVTAYSDTHLPAGRAYCYRVSAFNGGGRSSYSNEACGIAATFHDVPSLHWAWRHVEALAAFKVTAGCGDGRYCADRVVKRSEMAVFILRAKHGPGYAPPTGAGTAFSDVPASHWAADWIEELAAEQITGGCGAAHFCPEGTVTRAQMAVFLLTAKYGPGYAPPTAAGTVFSDVPAGHWSAAWIEQLVAEGITAGCSPATYCPDHPVTRGQMAVFLVRALGLPTPV